MPALSSRVFRPGAGRAAGVFCRLALVTVLTLAGNATLAAEDSVAPATALAPAAPWGDPLPLVRKGSWAAWEYGPEGNRGWTLIGDRFTASADS
ncbi:MAG TPA: hypothetical protein VGE52_15235, partial [Pirellulales bacterium]